MINIFKRSQEYAEFIPYLRFEIIKIKMDNKDIIVSPIIKKESVDLVSRLCFERIEKCDGLIINIVGEQKFYISEIKFLYKKLLVCSKTPSNKFPLFSFISKKENELVLKILDEFNYQRIDRLMKEFMRVYYSDAQYKKEKREKREERDFVKNYKNHLRILAELLGC